MKKETNKNNYLQVGQTIECGNCYPEKFENCKEITKKYPTIICNCVCHSTSATEEWEKETLAKKLHEWYLEACQKKESGMDFNPKAQEPYEGLKETQKFLDRYIAEKIIQLLEKSQKEANQEMYQALKEARHQFADEVLGELEKIKHTNCKLDGCDSPYQRNDTLSEVQEKIKKLKK